MKKRKIPKRTPEERAESEAIGERLRLRVEELTALEAAGIPDPESLSEDERAELIRAARQRADREFENRVIVAELRRRALEAQRKAS